MKADDEVLHSQLWHLAKTGRASVNGDTMVVVTSFYDDEKQANAVLAVFDASDDIPEDDQLPKIIDCFARALNNFLVVNTPMKVILRDEKTGKDFDISEGTFGHYAKEIEP